MKKSRIIEILKFRMSEICRGCKEKDLDHCFQKVDKGVVVQEGCKIHKLVNGVVEELNG